MRTNRTFEITFILAIVVSCSRGNRTKPSRAVDAATLCSNSPIFEKYRRRGLLKSSGAAQLGLDLPIDLHSSDCGAPDDYGHSMMLAMNVSNAAGACQILPSDAESRPFGPADLHVEPWHDSFTRINDRLGLDTKLARIELRDPRTQHALLLMTDAYYFYEDVGVDAELKPELEPEGATDCCYGYTSSAFISGSEADATP